uniref:Uncharacterized protein n=1 Tax=Arundo donax TaxID=35708 RepID=A0A0A9G457_ARUDO
MPYPFYYLPMGKGMRQSHMWGRKALPQIHKMPWAAHCEVTDSGVTSIKSERKLALYCLRRGLKIVGYDVKS